MWRELEAGVAWSDVVLGSSCTALAGFVGWRFVRHVAPSARWWWVGITFTTVVTVSTATLVSPLLAPALAWFTAAALVLAAVDSLLLRLPNALVYPTVLIVGIWLPLAALLSGQTHVALRVLGAGAGMGLAYLMLHLASPDGLGMGDVKFAPAIAMVMGWNSWGWAIVAGLVAFFLAATWGIAGAIARRRTKALPFGPFMVVGAGMTPVLADPLLDWWW